MAKDDDDSPFRKVFRRMMGTFAEHQWKSILASYCLQPPAEKKARLRAVVELSVELTEIKKTRRFGTALADSAIEAVIEGDWKKARMCISWFSFTDESEELRREEAPHWEKFRAILLAVCDGAEQRMVGVESPGRN